MVSVSGAIRLRACLRSASYAPIEGSPAKVCGSGYRHVFGGQGRERSSSGGAFVSSYAPLLFLFAILQPFGRLHRQELDTESYLGRLRACVTRVLWRL